MFFPFKPLYICSEFSIATLDSQRVFLQLMGVKKEKPGISFPAVLCGERTESWHPRLQHDNTKGFVSAWNDDCITGFEERLEKEWALRCYRT